MIWPARTSWPAKILTPRYCGFESRPFLDEPSPFLCAIATLPRDRRLERRDRSLARRLRPLVRERSLELVEAPALGRSAHLSDRHAFVPGREPTRRGRLRLGRGGGRRRLDRRLRCLDRRLAGLDR